MLKPDSISARAPLLLGLSSNFFTTESISAAGTWSTYLGPKAVDLEGGEAEIQPNERFGFEYRNKKWLISFREGKTLHTFQNKNPSIPAYILFQSRLPARLRTNINNAGVSQRGIKLEPAFIAKKELRNDDWFVPKGAVIYQDQHKNYYLDVDQRTPISKLDGLTKKARANVLTLFRKQGEIEVAPEPKPKPVTVKPKTEPKPTPTPDIVQIPEVTNLDELDLDGNVIPSIKSERKSTTYLVVMPTTREESVVASPAPTLASCNSIALDLASNKKLETLGANYTIYKVDDKQKSYRNLKPATVLVADTLKVLPVYKTQRLVFDITVGGYQDPMLDYGKLDEPTFALCDDNASRFYTWVSQAVSVGYFSKVLKPTVNKKHGLVFNIVSSGIERERMRLEIKSLCLHVLDYLKTYQELDNVKAKQKVGKSVAVVSFELPTLTQAQLESVSLLEARPPVLNSPLYFVKDQPQSTVTIQRVMLNTGEVIVHPARRQGFGEDPTIPRRDLGNLGVQTQGRWIERRVPYSMIEKLTMK